MDTQNTIPTSDTYTTETRNARRGFLLELAMLADRALAAPTPERRRVIECEIQIARDGLADIERAMQTEKREYLLRAAGQPTPEPLAPVSVYESRGFHVFKDGRRDGWRDL